MTTYKERSSDIVPDSIGHRSLSEENKARGSPAGAAPAWRDVRNQRLRKGAWSRLWEAKLRGQRLDQGTRSSRSLQGRTLDRRRYAEKHLHKPEQGF